MDARWKFNGIFKADAQKVADEIGERQITPSQVLELARDEDSELHKCFEWDDTVAAEKYRLQQARSVLRMLVYEPRTDNEQSVRCFSLTSEKSVYQPTRQFLVQEDEYQGLLKRALAELETFKKKYHMLTELEAIFEEIDKV